MGGASQDSTKRIAQFHQRQVGLFPTSQAVVGATRIAVQRREHR